MPRAAACWAWIALHPLRFAALAMVVALPFRMPAVVADLPWVYDYDEPFFVEEGLKMVDDTSIRPDAQNYGAVFKEAIAATTAGLGLVGFDRSDWSWRTSRAGDVRVANPLAWALLRLVPALLGVAVVGLAVLTAAELRAKPASLALVAAFVTLAPLTVTGFAKVSADPWAAGFVAVSCWGLARATRRGLLRPEARLDLVLTGAAAGLAAGSKYNAAAFVVGAVVAPLVAARIVRVRRWAVPVAVTVVAAAVAFVMSNPFFVADFAGFRADIRKPQTSYLLPRAGAEGRAGWFQLRVLFDNGLLAAVLAVAGVLLAVAVRRRALPWAAAVTTSVVLTVLLHARYNVRYERNVLSMVVPVLVLGVLAGEWLVEWIRSRDLPLGLSAFGRAGVVLGIAIVMLAAQGTKAAEATARSVGDERAAARHQLDSLQRAAPAATFWVQIHAPTPSSPDASVTTSSVEEVDLTANRAAGVRYYVFSSDQYEPILRDQARYGELIGAYGVLWAALCPIGDHDAFGTTVRIFEDCRR
ncbi:MAG: phospholipid carrier-dependent glycosyltransferase [Microthrixaceae bacterium]